MALVGEISCLYGAILRKSKELFILNLIEFVYNAGRYRAFLRFHLSALEQKAQIHPTLNIIM